MASMPKYLAKRRFEIMHSSTARWPLRFAARLQASISFPSMHSSSAGAGFGFFSCSGGGSGSSSLGVSICDARRRRC